MKGTKGISKLKEDCDILWLQVYGKGWLFCKLFRQGYCPLKLILWTPSRQVRKTPLQY